MKSVYAVGLVVGLTTLSVSAQDKGIGVGAILGEPIGASVKAWLTDNTAIDGALAYANWSDSGFQIHSDYLWHNFDWLGARFPVYFGVGARIKFADDTQFGFRGPIGVSYMLDQAPVDVFGEIAPIFDVAPGLRVEWSFAVGARYWF